MVFGTNTGHVAFAEIENNVAIKNGIIFFISNSIKSDRTNLHQIMAGLEL